MDHGSCTDVSQLAKVKRHVKLTKCMDFGADVTSTGRRIQHGRRFMEVI